MDDSIKKDFKKDMQRLVDLMIQGEAIKEQIATLKKDMKAEYEVPMPLITKVANMVRKDNLTEETEKWEELSDLVVACS